MADKEQIKKHIEELGYSDPLSLINDMIDLNLVSLPEIKSSSLVDRLNKQQEADAILKKDVEDADVEYISNLVNSGHISARVGDMLSGNQIMASTAVRIFESSLPICSLFALEDPESGTNFVEVFTEIAQDIMKQYGDSIDDVNFDLSRPASTEQLAQVLNYAFSRELCSREEIYSALYAKEVFVEIADRVSRYRKRWSSDNN